MNRLRERDVERDGHGDDGIYVRRLSQAPLEGGAKKKSRRFQTLARTGKCGINATRGGLKFKRSF